MIMHFVLYLMIAILIFVVIGFFLYVLNEYAKSRILSHVIDVVLWVCMVLAIEIVILIFIDIIL